MEPPPTATSPEAGDGVGGAGTPGEPRRVRLFGYQFDDLTQVGLVDRIAARLAEGGDPTWVATLNVNLLCIAHRDPGYRATLEGAEIITADGMPIIWMSALRKRRLTARVTGADLLVPLAERAAGAGWRIFLAGGAPGVAERVAEQLRERAPGVAIVGTATPPLMDYDELLASKADEVLLEEIREARPDVLLMALGSPKQERWISDHIRMGLLKVPVSVGVGAAFDFLAGRQSRAPGWMRRWGMEWCFRMLRSPGRLLPRYARDAWTFGVLCFAELRQGDR